MSRVGQLLEAKNKFSEVVGQALAHGPRSSQGVGLTP